MPSLESGVPASVGGHLDPGLPAPKRAGTGATLVQEPSSRTPTSDAAGWPPAAARAPSQPETPPFTSPILRAARARQQHQPAQPLPWYERSFLVPHEPIRYYTWLGGHVLHPSTFSSAHPGRAATWFAWYGSFYFPILHHHHTLEDDIYFPWVSTRLDAPLPASLAADHWHLDATLHEIKILGYWFRQCLKGMRNGSSSSSPIAEEQARHRFDELADQLRTKWAALTTLLTEHMDAEERILPPLLQAHYTPKEEAAIVQRMGLAGIWSSSNRRTIPGILVAMTRWGGEGQVRDFLAQLPPPLRLLALGMWLPAYKRQMREFKQAMLHA